MKETLWKALGALALALVVLLAMNWDGTFSFSSAPELLGTVPRAAEPTETTAQTGVSETTEDFGAPQETTYPPATVPSGYDETTSGAEPSTNPAKVIALTFDDGPSYSVTPQILDVLEKYGAKATFFVLGQNLSGSRADSLARAIRLGCEIGNHTASHSTLTALDSETLLREIRETNEKIRQCSGCDYTPTLLRPPGGHTSDDVLQTLYRGGLRMHTILWNDDSRDWAYNTSYKNGEISYETAASKTCELLLSEASNGGIVLMHDIKEITPEVLERVLIRLRAEGYTFVTVSELFDFDSMGKDAYLSLFYAQNDIR